MSYIVINSNKKCILDRKDRKPINRKVYYFDSAANTPVDQRVLNAMYPYLNQYFGNAASLHQFGMKMREAAEKARHQLARMIGADDSEIIFCASATEANNTVIRGIAENRANRGKHIILSAVEHPSVYNLGEYLQSIGFQVDYAAVDSQGRLKMDDFKQMLKPETILVSVMHINNELGVIQPISEIAEICDKNNIVFHTDASQSFGRMPIEVGQQINCMTASSHKIYGPLGAAMIYCRKDTMFTPLISGGQQESGRRASTLNVPAIVGFGEAASIFQQSYQSEWEQLNRKREKLKDKLLQDIPDCQMLGSEEHQAPHILTAAFRDTDSELLQMELDRKGIAIATGSACTSAKIKTSYVLTACGLDARWAAGTIRISLSRFTKDDEIEYLLAALPKAVQKIRSLS
ncbi:MAG: aminotransferase class V-fold PLP-dependent enzyme [Caldithrix sp.]|nr:aminotransferase class V-fold PLP-dependent enzyme [Caldithrix sp.]